MNLSEKELKNIILSVSSIVLSAGSIIAKAFTSSVASTEKTSAHDVVTKFDVEGEEYIYKKLLSLYPDFGFLGEERGYRNYNDSDPYWIVDPIDGTLNFARGIPTFATSVALVQHKKTYAAICYNPISKELFTATLGGGAFLNGKKIEVSNVKTLSRSIISVPIQQLSRSNANVVVRRQGSSVLDICYIAKGSVDAYYDTCLYPWDFAASSLIASEAGAEIFSLKSKTLDTNKKSDILVANKNIVDEFTKWISTEAL